jgi:hypothetical protein
MDYFRRSTSLPGTNHDIKMTMIYTYRTGNARPRGGEKRWEKRSQEPFRPLKSLRFEHKISAGH